MIPSKQRFIPVFEHFGLDVIAPEVEERMEEDDILKYAGKFDATICGDDQYSRRVLEKCSPRLKVISKWGTGIDSIDQKACLELEIQLKNRKEKRYYTCNTCQNACYKINHCKLFATNAGLKKNTHKD